MTTYCPNSEAAHAHLDDEERRERIGERAEELARDMVADDLGDSSVIATAFEDEPSLAKSLVAALTYNDLSILRRALVVVLMQRRRDEAIRQAEREAQQ